MITCDKTTIDNGIRVITEKMSHFNSIALALYVLVGSRDETESINGISHFIEHLLLKKIWREAKEKVMPLIDFVKGVTTKEYTCFYGIFLKEEVEYFFDLFLKVFQNFFFQKNEFERERAVILQEIMHFENSLSEQPLYGLSRLLFGNHSLSYPVIGTVKSVTSLTPNKILHFLSETFVGENILIVASGNVMHNEIVSLATKKFSRIKTGNSLKRVPPLKTLAQRMRVRTIEKGMQSYGAWNRRDQK